MSAMRIRLWVATRNLGSAKPEWRIWPGFQSIKLSKIKNCALQNTILHAFGGSNSHVHLIITLAR